MNSYDRVLSVNVETAVVSSPVELFYVALVSHVWYMLSEEDCLRGAVKIPNVACIPKSSSHFIRCLFYLR